MSTGRGSEQVKGRRVSIDLTPTAAQEVDRLREVTGLTTADLFRNALHLFRIYVMERGQGKIFYVSDATDSQQNRTRIELAVPFSGEYVVEPQKEPF